MDQLTHVIIVILPLIPILFWLWMFWICPTMRTYLNVLFLLHEEVTQRLTGGWSLFS